MHADRVRKKKFHHNGELKIGDLTILWKEIAGGEIVFKIPGDNDDKAAYSKISTLTKYLRDNKPALFKNLDPVTREGVELAIVNPLLAHYRPHAVPDKNNYYAASAGVTQSGKLFMAVNNEVVIKHAFAGRGCAETTMLRKCQEALGKTDVELSSVYLMSGMASKLPNGKLVDKKAGHVSCLCGECRENLRNHTQQARFIMVPSNDGTLPLQLNDTADFDQLNPGDAWEISHQLLYPLAETRELTNEDAKKVLAGHAYITNKALPTVRLALGLPDDPAQLTGEQYQLLRDEMEKPSMEIRALRGERGTLENTNLALLSYLKDAYNHHPDRLPVRNIEIIGVIVKTNDGEHYPAVLVNGELWLPSKPPEIPTALSNAYNQKGIAEVTIMPFDDHALQAERASMRETGEATHTVKLPDPAGLGRLLKNMNIEDNTPIRILPINNGLLSGEELKALSEPLLDPRREFGPDFASPKGTIAQAVGQSQLVEAGLAKSS